MVYAIENGEELDKYLFSSFGVKRKFKNKNYRIDLANQFNKNPIIKKIELKGYKVVYVSGTIKKCKKVMDIQLVTSSHE